MGEIKVMPVFGTRPEAVKMCPLIAELKKRKRIKTVVTVSAQHRQMLDRVLQVFGVVPDHDLDIMREHQTLFDITGSILRGMRDVLSREKPDLVLVHGDTTTTFAAALSCYYMGIKVGHVEAGLRTYDIDRPYPEEFNRGAVDMISDLCFAPTDMAVSNLIRSGKKKEQIFLTGNTVIDAMRYTVREDYLHPELEWAKGYRLIFITAHRRENLGEPMHRMFRGIRRCLDEHPDCRAVYPIHPNPLIRQAAAEEFEGCDNIHLIEPLGITDCHNLESRAYLCITDSGGLQEECPAFGVPVLVMRDITERPEGVEAGVLRLLGTDEERIYSGLGLLLDDEKEYGKMSHASNPYGDGHACGRIADILEELL